MNSYFNNLSSYEYDFKNDITFSDDINFSLRTKMSNIIENTRIFYKCTSYIRDQIAANKAKAQALAQENSEDGDYCYYKNEEYYNCFNEEQVRKRRRLNIDDSLSPMRPVEDAICDMV